MVWSIRNRPRRQRFGDVRRTRLAIHRCGIEPLEPRYVLSAVLVADVNQTGAHSTPSDFLDADGTIYFRADHPIYGSELWKSDGTTEGTQLLADIVPGSGSSFPESMAQVGNQVFFTEGNGWKPHAVWRTDGTAAGTIRLRQFSDEVSRCCAQRFEFVDFQGTAYFMAFDVNPIPTSHFTGFQNQASLWTSDGTPEGTTLVAPLGNSFGRTGLAVYDDRMYFVLERYTNDLSTGVYDVWESDGTAVGTRTIASFRPDHKQTYDHDFGHQDLLTYSGGAFYFAQNNATAPNANGLYKLNRDTTGQWQNSLIFPSSDRISEIRAAHGGLYFLAESNGGGLWYSDGTPAGTRLVKSLDSASLLRIADDHVFLFRRINNASAYELWTSDGTTVGTTRLRTFAPGDVDSLLRKVTTVAGQLAFVADDTQHGLELWMSDGTSAGTRLVRDINPGSAWSNPGLLPGKLLVQGNRLFFNANDGVHGEEFWTSDGTEADTYLVKDIDEGTATASSAPKLFSSGDNTAYFTADDGVRGRETWRTDLATDATELAFDLVPGAASPFDYKGDNIDEEQFNSWRSFDSTGPYGINGTIGWAMENRSAYYGGYYYFSTLIGDAWKLYRTDGTRGGTVVIAQENDYGWPPHGFLEHNGRLLFFTRDKLFMIASPGATPQVLATGEGTFNGAVTATRSGEFVYFNGPGWELWRTDGTPQRTLRVSDIVPGSEGSGPGSFSQIGDDLLFHAYDPTHCVELWRTDGTPAGTEMVADINTQAGLSGRNGCSAPSPIIEVGGTGLFFADDGMHGRELWKSDGTEQGTVLVKDLVPGIDQFKRLWPAVNLNGSLLFFAEDWQFRNSLWRSDGTEAGTRLVREFLDCSNREAGSSSLACQLIVHDGEAYFSAKDETHGEELWKTDGTPEGTVLVADILPGSRSSFPINFHEAYGNLYFVANDGIHGRELWRLSTAADCDLNGSGVVDAGDVAILARNFGMASGARPADGDMDANGQIDAHDLMMLQQHLGEVVARPAAPAAAVAVAVAPVQSLPSNRASQVLRATVATRGETGVLASLRQTATTPLAASPRITRLSPDAVDRLHSRSTAADSQREARPMRASRSSGTGSSRPSVEIVSFTN